MQRYLNSTEETEQFGAELFMSLPTKCLVFLHGDLGAGKTTLVRGFLRAAGYNLNAISFRLSDAGPCF